MSAGAGERARAAGGAASTGAGDGTAMGRDAARARPPRAVPLLGPDVVLLAMETLAAGRAASSNAVLALVLDAPVAAARVEAALARLLPRVPWLGGRLVRPRPWGKLVWRVPRRGPTPPPVVVAANRALAAVVDRELAVPIDPWREPPLRLTLATGDAYTHLVLTWAHALMDPRGAEYLVRLLAAIDAEPDGASPWQPPPLLALPPDPRPLRERGALARRGAAELRGLVDRPPPSLAAAPHPDAPTAARHWRFRFAPPPSPPERLRRGMPWRLAVVARAMEARFAARGLASDVPFLVPVSVDRRPRGEPGPLLGNDLAFHFARARLPADGDTAALARTLHDQLADAVRRDALEAGFVGMSFARWRPLRGMFRELPWAARGDFCSFHFADTDAVLPECPRLFGAGVADGYHVAAVPARPGAGVFLGRHAGAESLVVGTAGGVLDATDAAAIAADVARELGWRPLAAA